MNVAIMPSRTQITLDPQTQRLARTKAADLGISFAEYVRRLLLNDLGQPRPKSDISVVFDLVDQGPMTNVAREKKKMIAEAVWEDFQRGTERKPRPRPPRRKSRA